MLALINCCRQKQMRVEYKWVTLCGPVVRATGSKPDGTAVGCSLSWPGGRGRSPGGWVEAREAQEGEAQAREAQESKSRSICCMSWCCHRSSESLGTRHWAGRVDDADGVQGRRSSKAWQPGCRSFSFSRSLARALSLPFSLPSSPASLPFRSLSLSLGRVGHTHPRTCSRAYRSDSASVPNLAASCLQRALPASWPCS